MAPVVAELQDRAAFEHLPVHAGQPRSPRR
jgi:hypothetical protein